MGPYWFGPPRSTFTVSGGVLRVFSILHHHRFLTPAIPLCGLPFSSKQHLATALTCAGECTSPGVPFPLQRSTTGGARIPRWLTSPPALSVHRVSHPLNGLLRPRSCQALPASVIPPFVPTALLGFPRLPSARVSLCSEGRAERLRVSSPRLSPTPRRARVRALSSRALRRCLPRILSGSEGALNDGRSRVSIAGSSALPR